MTDVRGVTELVPRGPFSLKAAAEFGFGPHRGGAFGGAMALAFAAERGVWYAGAILRQREPDGPVGVELHTRDGADPGPNLLQAR